MKSIDIYPLQFFENGSFEVLRHEMYPVFEKTALKYASVEEFIEGFYKNGRSKSLLNVILLATVKTKNLIYYEKWWTPVF